MILQVGVKVLLKTQEGKYLFLKRAASFKPGTQQWDIPGGRINPDEPLDTALAREVQEETGLALGDHHLIAAQDIFNHDKDLHVVRLTYIGETSGSETVSISDEHAEYKWLTKDEIDTEQLDPYLLKIIDTF